jgi:hypothetical protein
VPLKKGSTEVTELPLGAGTPPPAAPVPRAGDEILVAFAGPARQRRVTVLFRLLLAIPHFIVLYFVALIAAVVVVIAWFYALFTGRLPGALADFLVGWLRWLTRVYAYAALLTGRYPPFGLADADYPVRISVAPGRLNRLAVLFRLILVIPAWILASLVSYGVGVVLIVIWLIVLVTGAMPGALYQAVAAAIRYGARYYGYFFLMSGTYPGGLFGDPAEPEVAPMATGLLAAPVDTGPGQPGEAPPGAAPAAYGQEADGQEADAPPGTGQPGNGQRGNGQPGDRQPGDGQRAGAQPGDGQPGDWPPGYGQAPPAVSWPTDPRAWRLVLSTGARRLVGLFIAVGAVVLAAYIIFTVNLASRSADNATRVDAINNISAAHSKLVGQLNVLSQQAAACQNQPGTLTCVTKLDQQAAADIGAFGGSVRSTPVPSSAAPAEDQLAAATDQVRSAFQQLGAATSVTQYEQIDASTVGPSVAQFNSAYQNLGRALGAS